MQCQLGVLDLRSFRVWGFMELGTILISGIQDIFRFAFRDYWGKEMEFRV